MGTEEQGLLFCGAVIRDETRLPRLTVSDRKPMYILPGHSGPRLHGTCFVTWPTLWMGRTLAPLLGE